MPPICFVTFDGLEFLTEEVLYKTQRGQNPLKLNFSLGSVTLDKQPIEIWP